MFKKAPENEKFNQAKFDQNKAIIEMYIDNTKTYIQLGSAALGTLLVFGEKIQVKAAYPGWTGFALALIVLSMGLAAAYQYYSVKYVDRRSLEPDQVSCCKKIQGIFIESPGYIYGAMLGTFYSGFFILTFFVVLSFCPGK